MFNFFRRPPNQLIIDNGRVFCPVRQCDTDIDICGGCNRITEFNPDGNPPYVRCRLEAAPLPPAGCCG